MTVSFSFLPDERLEKHVKRWRFAYDKELLKSNHPLISVLGPQKMRINPNRVSMHVDHALRSLKSIRLETVAPLSMLNGDLFDIYITIDRPNALLLYRRTIQDTALFGPLTDEGFNPHICIARQIQESRVEDILFDLGQEKFNHHFFAKQMAFYMRTANEPWEIQTVFEL